jgi:hypothetical protein
VKRKVAIMHTLLYKEYSKMLGEYAFPKKSMEEKELMLKALVYNQFFVKWL